MSRVGLLASVVNALSVGRRLAIATVIGASGSTPRHLGARMFVAADGQQWGTIGGGRIEQVVVEAAQRVARGEPAHVVEQHLVRDLAMCCGGSMQVVISRAMDSRDALGQLVNLARPRTLVTPIDGSPLLLREPRDDDPRPHRPAIRDGALVERVGPTERAIVFGLGHVAKSVGPMLAGLGFEVIVCDDGDTGATAERPAWADRVIESFDPAEVERELGGFTANDRVLIVTRDHAIDQQLLERLIGNASIGYLGMIGSRGKVGRFRKRLEAKGLYDEATWQRLRAPIGLDIGAETPEEIAVAIAAELVALRRLGVTSAGDWRPRRAEEP